MDNFAFASLAHFRILLVPVGAIPRTTFERLVTEVRSFETIRLGDIPADAKDERARFMPNPLSTGHLLLSFPTHPPPHSHLPLSLFRPSHFPLAVIGIAVCSQSESLPSIHAQFNESLIDFFPPGSVFPLAKNCFVYDESEEGSLNFTDNLPGLVVIPKVMGHKRLYIGTLLAGLCSNILEGFAVLVQTLESPIGNEYLNSSLLPLLPSQTELPSRLGAIASNQANADLTKHSVALGPAPAGKRSGSTLRQATLTTAPKKRMSTIGVASSLGRLYKVLGDLFLLAGRVNDALVWYVEALQLFKNSQDFAWHASVLEGMATLSVVEAWTAGQGLHSSLSSSREPWSDISEKLSQAASLYQKSAIPEGEQNYAHLSFLYTTCVLRHASLFFSVWSAKGWGPLAFMTMLQPGPSPYLPPTLSHEESTVWSNLERLSSLSGVTRSSISSIIAQAHGPWLLHLAPRERIGILEVMASLYACIGYRRKEIYILREVLGCIMDLVVCGREEDGLSRPTNVPETSGLGLREHVKGASSGDGAVGIRFGERDDGNDSVLRLLKHICKVLGVDLEAVRMITTDEESDQDGQQTEPDTDNICQDLHGWPELQVGVVREAVAVAEALPDFPAVAQFAASSLKTLRSNLTPADQFHLYSTSARALSTARRRGDLRKIEYWSGQPIVNISITPIPLIRLPIAKPLSALQPRISDIAPILTGAVDPFLYNPRKAVTGESKPLVVQNESLEFNVTLHNPYVFDLEIQSLSLSTSGVDFVSQPARITIPGDSVQQVIISGKPLSSGSLVIRGCSIQAPGGASREFILPLLTSQEEERLARRRSAIACESGRWKYSGLECFPWTQSKVSGVTHSATQTTARFLECQVVPELPLLRIRRTSVTHGAVMLYEGEKSPIRITVENVSHLPIDFVRLVFDDSTIGPAQQSLADGELSVFDTYETEYSLLHRAVLSCKKDDSVIIPPGQSHTLSIQCFGKFGCTNGTVHISYAFAQRPEAETTKVFHTRQLSYSMVVTVYQMLECYGMDILPHPSYPTAGKDADEVLLTNQSGWCLFSVDVRNTYGSPFDVTLERVQEDSVSTTVTIPPGSTTKLLIPLKKISLSYDLLSKPIPTLSDRQFVVTKSNLSTSEQQLQRELFWYREELFRIVRGRWRESGGTRSGELSLRKQRMTLSMLEAIRMENVHIELVLRTPDGAPVTEPNDFICLRALVKNVSSSAGVFVMNLNMEPSDDILHEGVIQDVPLGRLEPGASREIDTTVCFLAHGYFEVLAEVRLVEAGQFSKAGIGYLKVALPGGIR